MFCKKFFRIIFLIMLLAFSVTFQNCSDSSNPAGLTEIKPQSETVDKILPCVLGSNLELISTLTYRVTWLPALLDNVIGYHIQVADNWYMQDPIIDITTDSTEHVFSLTSSGTYYIRMRVVGLILGLKVYGPFCGFPVAFFAPK